VSQITELLTTIITNLYVQTSVFGLILAMAIESCCIPLPSEVVIPVAGLLFAQGKLLPGMDPILGIIVIGLAGSIGCVLGSTAAYWIGYKGGRPLMLKYGRYVLISQHDTDVADRFFQRYGSATAFFSRLLPVVRTYISLPAGMSKMSFNRFWIYSFLGSFPWCVLLAYAGYVLGNNMSKIDPYYKVAQYVVIAALVVLVVLYLWRHIHNDNKARAAHAASEAASAEAAAPLSAAPAPEFENQQAQQPWNQQQQAQQPWNQQQQAQQPWNQQQQAQQPWNQQQSSQKPR
jgi:Uncharacterized membrane-associated protein